MKAKTERKSGVDFKKLREPQSTEMVECGYCGEMVDSRDAEWDGCWIGLCCMKWAWAKRCEGAHG